MSVANHRLKTWMYEGNEAVIGEFNGSLFACLKEFVRLCNRNPWKVTLECYDQSDGILAEHWYTVLSYNRFGLNPKSIPFE